MSNIKLEKIKTPFELGRAACDTLMNSYTPNELPPADRWHYHQGVFLVGMERLYNQVGGEDYLNYIKRYVDNFVDENGNFLFDRKSLDSIQVGLLLFKLYRETKDKRYKIAATKLRNTFNTFHKTSEGGFWHMDIFPYQMWLDGLYMGGAFAMNYAKEFNEPELLEMVVEQERLMRKNTRDENTGLFYHAWDESRKQLWANPRTGKSPEFWGRAIGWYGIAFNEILDFLPEDHQSRPEIKQSLKDLIDGLLKFQDEESGLWYQVVDKGDREDNWLETSCSSLFVYTIAKAMNNGHVEKDYVDAAIRGYRGLVDVIQFDEEGKFILPDICIGTGVGDYQHYVNRSKCKNDLHGVGAFVLTSVEMQNILGEL